MKRIIIAMLSVLMVSLCAEAIKMKDLKIYINPGHGGYTSNDRPISIFPYASGDTAGYWESKSNLIKGIDMYHILDSLGTKAYLSRTMNDDEVYDRDLYDIAYEANNLGCDLFFSIHSNAGESVNYPLTLYREDAVGTPRYPGAVTLSNLLWNNLHSSKLSIWTRDTPYVSGDLTFYPQWGTQGLGVLRRLYVVGLLSEGGMHEHRPEAHRLMNKDFCWLEAWHFVKTIMEYYNTEDRFVTGNVAGVAYDDHNTREETLNFTYFSAYGRDRNKPLNGTLVQLKDQSGTVVQSRVTDNDNNGVYVFRNVSPGTYTVVSSRDGYYSNSKLVTVTANEVTYNDMPMMLKREMPLEISSYSPNPGQGELVSCVEPLVFNFNSDVAESSFVKAFKIEPAVEGVVSYSNSFHKVTFKPNVAYALSTHYKVTITTDATTPDTIFTQSHLQKDFVLEFDTKGRNKLEMVQSSPVEGDEVYYKSPIFEFRFDKTLDISGIYDNIVIYDKNNNALSVNKRTSTFNKLSNDYGSAQFVMLNNLTVGDSYRAVISGALKDKEGVPLTDGITINFKAVDATGTHAGTVIEDFEGGNSSFVADTVSEIGMSVVPEYYKSTTKYLFDAASGRFVYNFANSKDGAAVWNYKGAYHVAKKGATFGAYVNGDLNGHELYFGFTSGTDTKYIRVCNMDFLGWRYVEVKLDALLDDFEYLFSKVKLVQRDALYAQKGAFQLDNLLYDGSSTGIGEVETSVARVYPNPASTEIHVSGLESVEKMELYDISGHQVKYAEGATMQISSINAGMYILCVESDAGRKSYKIEIRR